MASLAAVLFTDLVGSTALRADLGEERADELRAVHDRLLAERIKAHGGQVLKSTGDGLVAAFASASEALTAAVESQQALDRYSRRLDAIAPLLVRMGLSVGDVSWEGGDCFGTPLAEAARLEAEAEGGQILCSEFVRVMAKGRGGHEFRDLGFFTLKGLPEPLATCEVVWAPAAEPKPLPLPPELGAEERRLFVSRRAELELAEAVLADSQPRRAAVLWLLGEPGIGKTRLATEMARRAHAAGALVLFGRCSEDLSVPYQPFLEALRWFVAHVPDDELAGRLGDSPAELARLVPELAGRLPVQGAPQSSSPEIEQHRLFEAVRSWLAASGGDRPVVAVLDDVHWADRTTLQLLGHVVRRAEPSTAVLVCTARNTSPDDNEVLSALAEELDRRAAPSHRLELAGLGVEDVSELVSSAAGRRLDDRLGLLAAQLQRETAGNPLFVDALLTSLRADSAWYAGALPRSLTETVRRRVARLSGDVQNLLRVASIVGLDFDLRVAARAAGHNEFSAVETLERAARAGLVHEGGANRYRFAHALVRAALREELSESRRVRIHLQVGEAMEAVHRQHRDEYAGELAYHFYEAVPAGGAARAYRYSLLSAERATRLLAHEEAAAAYGRVLELLDVVEDTEALNRYELLLARGEAQRRAGDFNAAKTTLQVAAEEAGVQGGSEVMARAAVAYEDVGWWPGFVGAEAVELLVRAEVALPAEESPLRALTVASLSRALEFSGRRAEGIERGEEALAIARRLADPATTAAVLMRTSFGYTTIEHAPLLAARCAELRALADQLGDDELYTFALNHGAIASAQLADMVTYEALLDDMFVAIGRLRQPHWEHCLAVFRQLRAFLAGDLESAERLLADAHELGQTLRWDTEGVYGVNMFILRREQGQLEGLAPALRTMVRLNPRASLWRPGLAALYAELGMLHEARAEFEVLAAEDFAAVPEDGSLVFSLSLLAEVCCALGDRVRAGWLLDRLRPCEGRLLVFVGNFACLGPADRLLGMLAFTAGHLAEGDRWLARALELSRRLDSPVWIAHCLYDYAVRVATDAPAAYSMLAEAAALCERHGLRALGQQVAAGMGQDDPPA